MTDEERLAMRDWYVTDGGRRWQLCRATVILGTASAVLRDGTPVSGRARRAGKGFGWIVEEK